MVNISTTNGSGLFEFDYLSRCGLHLKSSVLPPAFHGYSHFYLRIMVPSQWLNFCFRWTIRRRHGYYRSARHTAESVVCYWLGYSYVW